MNFLKKLLLVGVIFLGGTQVTWSMEGLSSGERDTGESRRKTPSKPKAMDKKGDKRTPREESKKATQEASTISREVTRLSQKLEQTNVSNPNSSGSVKWDSSRVFTPYN